MFSKILNVLQAQLNRPEGPLDYHTWVFSSVDNRNFNYNSKYLFLYVKEHMPGIDPVFVMNDAGRREQLSKQYGKRYFIDSGNPEGMKRVLQAGVWITSAGLPVYEWSGDRRRIVVNLWHGIPLKKIVLMEEHSSFLRNFYFKRMFSVKYTDIVTTSASLKKVMADSFGVSEDIVKVWGQPRNDRILEGRAVQELLQMLSIPEEQCRSLILYAPTYRDNGSTMLFPFADYDAMELELFLRKHGCHICIRMHLEDSVSEDGYRSDYIHFVNEDIIDDIAEWMGCFDGLITDYSSIYLDYLLLDRPMIFLPYDREDYLRERGMNFSYDQVTPGPKPGTFHEFLTALEKTAAGADGYERQRERCNDYFNEIQAPCCDVICREILKQIP